MPPRPSSITSWRLASSMCFGSCATYIAYHHDDRTHLDLAKDTPNPREIQKRPSPNAVLVGSPRIGGLHHRYSWEKVA